MIAHLTVCAHPVAYILADRRGEEDVFLGNDAGVGAEVVQVVASQRVPVQRDAARDDVVESLHEGDRGRFPATGLANKRNLSVQPLSLSFGRRRKGSGCTYWPGSTEKESPRSTFFCFSVGSVRKDITETH